MRTLSAKLILLLVVAALVPITLYGILSIYTSRQAYFETVTQGNQNVAKRAADQIGLYVEQSIDVLRALAKNIHQPDLLDWQRERIIKSYLLEMKEFQKIELLDKNGKQVITTEVGFPLKDRSENEAYRTAIRGRIYQSEVFISDNLVPTLTIAIPLKQLNQVDGVLLGDIDMTRMWRLVDSIRIGKQGYAFVTSSKGDLIAHGSGEGKVRILRHENVSPLKVVQEALSGRSSAMVYRNGSAQVVGVGVPISKLSWAMVIEQPTQEAYAAVTSLTRQLSVLIGVFLFLTAILGYWGGRKYVVEPIYALITGTRKVASGNLDGKVNLSSGDEFEELGTAFNTMTGRLKQLQEEIRIQERMALFGRIAAGLAHDLKHPIRNIENTGRLLLKKFDDPGNRDLFKRVMEKETVNINRFLENLHQLTTPTALQFISLDLCQFVAEVMDLFQKEAESRHILSILERPENPLWVRTDRFALERVLKNIIVNAMEAMTDGGTLKILLKPAHQSVEIQIFDTGYGIPKDRLPMLFTEFGTTKRKGLGLGLALSKKIVQELNGTIGVESEVGKGTRFILTVPTVND